MIWKLFTPAYLQIYGMICVKTDSSKFISSGNFWEPFTYLCFVESRNIEKHMQIAMNRR